MQTTTTTTTTTTTRRRDSGVTLAEMLVYGVIAGVIGVIVAGLLGTIGLAHVKSTAATITLSQLEDASGQLLRDVNDGRRLTVAAPDRLTVQVLRDSVCTERAWTVEGDTLVVATRTYTTDSCSGGSTENRAEVVRHGLTSPEPFRFYSVLSQRNAMRLPIIPAEVRRVTWDLSAMPHVEDAKEVQLHSGAAFTGTGSRSDGTGIQADDALRPLLTVTTERPGVEHPELTWVDKSPTVTDRWTVYRIAYPEGAAAPTSWSAIMQLPAKTTTWQDVSLEDGYTGQYVVVASLLDGREGPASNQVSTGLRPAAPTITATGATTSIAVSWNAVAGADSYDVYRDGKLTKVGLTATTFTDKSGEHAWTGSGYGHAHTYNVVAVNRWERAATNPTQKQDQRLTVGQDAGAALGLPSAKRALSDPASAWTAPAAVALTVADRPVAGDPADPASTWDPTVDVDWTPSAWVGDYAAAAKAATRYAVTRGGTTLATGTTKLAIDDAAAPRGASSTWTVVPTAGGLTGPSESASLLTWPSAATCTATLGGGGHGTTRAATVTVAEPAGQTVTGVRHARTSDRLAAATTPKVWTDLPDGTTTTWRAQAKNGAGYGPFGTACTAKTDVLAVAVTARTGDPATRAIDATTAVTVGGAARTDAQLAAAGISATTGIERVDGASLDARNHSYSSVGAHGWAWLVDGAAFRVTAAATDGLNTATATARADTERLVATTPTFTAPTCYGTASGYAPGRITWTAPAGATWLYREGVGESPAGTYRAGVTRTVTETLTDGFNTATASATKTGSCAATLVNPPIVAPGCALVPASSAWVGNVGSINASLTYCTRVGATGYEVSMRVRDRVFPAVGEWSTWTAWTSPIGDDGAIAQRVASTAVSPLVADAYQWRVRAVFPTGTSQWVESPWVYDLS